MTSKKELIVKGYIINRKDFELDSEIITILTDDGKIIECYSQSSKKIGSKNARNLFEWVYTEFHIFYGGNLDLSKIKKAVSLEENYQWNIEQIRTLLLLNFFTEKKMRDSDFVTFYKKIIRLTKEEKESLYYTNLRIIFKFIKDFEYHLLDMDWAKSNRFKDMPKEYVNNLLFEKIIYPAFKNKLSTLDAHTMCVFFILNEDKYKKENDSLYKELFDYWLNFFKNNKEFDFYHLFN